MGVGRQGGRGRDASRPEDGNNNGEAGRVRHDPKAEYPEDARNLILFGGNKRKHDNDRGNGDKEENGLDSHRTEMAQKFTSRLEGNHESSGRGAITSGRRRAARSVHRCCSCYSALTRSQASL